jgi:hypothetical protein
MPLPRSIAGEPSGAATTIPVSDQADTHVRIVYFENVDRA